MIFASLLAFSGVASAVVLPRQNTPVQLAVKPNCGDLSGAPADLNSGIHSLDYYNTIVSFGDSYSSGDKTDGSPLSPPVMNPPNPNAGGRVTNGRLWVERLAQTAGADLQDYAVNGSVVDATQYVGVPIGKARDFKDSVQYYITQGDRTDPETTLYTIFMGIGDYYRRDDLYRQSFTQVADTIIYNTITLIGAPIFGRNFIFVDNYGLGTKTEEGEAYKQELFDGLRTLKDKYAQLYGLNIAFVDLYTLWNAALTDPSSFGYTSTDACTRNDQTTQGACADPDHTLYWVPGNPSQATHQLMAEYIQEVIEQCQI